MLASVASLFSLLLFASFIQTDCSIIIGVFCCVITSQCCLQLVDNFFDVDHASGLV